MRLCIYEDRAVGRLEPLTLTRPAFDLWCGAATLRQRQHQAIGGHEVGAVVRPALAELCQLMHPELAAVNDFEWLRRGPTVMVNARWLPPAERITDCTTPRVGLVNDHIAYVILPPGTAPEWSPDPIDDWMERHKQSLLPCAAGGTIIDYPWDLVQHNPAVLCHDLADFRQAKQGRTRAGGIQVVGREDRLVIDTEAEIEPFVVADTRNGPVLIDRGAVVHAFSRLEGPCYIGEGTSILGAKLRGGTIGPACRIGGELEASIIQGFSNKYHDGFLGHSYVGEWVNLAAGTELGDLRNDYGTVKVTLAGERVSTGLTKVGAFIGDHTKTGLGALLNTGSVIGAFCNLLPNGSLLPTWIPSFCTVKGDGIQERNDQRQLITTAAAVMRRRGRELTATHVDLVFSLHAQTLAQRRDLIRDSERRRVQSV